jgi:hypothetical protein
MNYSQVNLKIEDGDGDINDARLQNYASKYLNRPKNCMISFDQCKIKNYIFSKNIRHVLCNKRHIV